MEHPISLYNSKTRKKEQFIPLNPPFVGMYLCGPTVYGHAHLGHSRGALTFDVLFRYLEKLGYKVRYVRNITDVGHLENDADEGEDKIAKRARLEQLEPMEIAQFYSNSYQLNMRQLNTKRPSIEPRATGHIIEQIEIISSILEAGYAYEVNGSVYFDVLEYSKTHEYGSLSGRVLEDLMQSGRELEGQAEKKNSVDFALWKKASPEHIMRWPSPWSVGFPGWHLECSAMSTKYLGEVFDIHGGGMDLLFPHHECEIAQSFAASGKDPVRYWLHNNMITIDGQKMAKSLGNFITLNDLFDGTHEKLSQAFSPMTMRFFILQAHYRSTLDFSNEALVAAEKGYKRLMAASHILENLEASADSSFSVEDSSGRIFDALNDDLSTPVAIAELFDLSKKINQLKSGEQSLKEIDLSRLKELFNSVVFEILGLRDEEVEVLDSSDDLMDLMLNVRTMAKQKKEFELSDFIRDELNALGFEIRDVPGGTEWKRK